MACRLRASKKPSDDPRAAVSERLKGVKRDLGFDMALAACIRPARLAAGMGQIVLGDAVGVSFRQVQKYDIGQDRVTSSTLQSVPVALRMHPGLWFHEEMPVPTGRSIHDVKRVLRATDVMGQFSDSRVLRECSALAKGLAETGDGEASAEDDHPLIAL